MKNEKLDPALLCRPRVSLLDCFKLLTSNELIADFYNEETKKHGNALKSISFTTFPDFLFIQMRKFTLAKDWSPVKLDVEIFAPDVIDLNEYRGGYGLKKGEIELMSDNAAAKVEAVSVEVQLNENIVAQLMDMGFSLDGSKRAAYNTREVNDFEAAVNWAVSHMEDADFNNHFEIPKVQSTKTAATQTFKPDEDSIQFIMGMGFTKQQASKALKETNNNLERAADWIFSHADELMNVDEEENSGSTASKAASAPIKTSQANNLRDAHGNYELCGFVSHMGTNANVGHYVVHIKKEGKWYIYNDQNVCESEKSHKELAYLYIYRRI
jgi:ubiquitin carboxyl-terminal hydrolase 5/13